MLGASSLALSPDGKSLYAGAYGSDSVSTFGRSKGGDLAFRGCVANGGAGGCEDTPSDVLGGVSGVAVSPGGGDVYVTAGLGRSVTRFSRSDSGELSFGRCTANNGVAGCENPLHDTLIGADGVAVGPGGGDIYVTSVDGAAVTHLTRGADGTLATADCLADAGNYDCEETPGAVLEGAASISIAPKGRDVYVASVLSGSLTHLTRGSDGELAYAQCWADGGANGCRKLPVDSLVGATGLALSGDGKRVFVASQVGVVSSFSRKRKTGKLKFVSCVGRDGRGGCSKPKRSSLGGATGVAVAGKDVYVASGGGDSITRLTVDRHGRLAGSTCIAAKRANECRGGAPAASLDGAYALLAEAGSLYVASSTSGAVSHFALPGK